MSINGIYQFGTLTTKSGKVINFDDLDTDKDGKLSQQEFNLIQKELGLDIVEFINEEQKGEKNVSDFEFIWWQQEAKIQEKFNNLVTQVAKDFIGENAQNSIIVIKELRDFIDDFKLSYQNGEKPILNMEDDFNQILPEMYNKLKENYMK